MAELESARTKFRRAMEHAEAFDNARQAFFETEPYTTVGRFNVHTRQYVEHLVVRDEAPGNLSATFGDLLFNLRSALDHAVYELAILNTGSDPPPDPGGIEFPVFIGGDDFQRARKRRISSLSVDAQAVIEALQSFQPGEGGSANTLWVLHELNRLDKHRRLHAVACMLGDTITFLGNEPADLPIELFWMTPPGILEDDAPLIKFMVRGSEKKVKVNVRIGFDAAIREGPEIDPQMAAMPLGRLVPIVCQRVDQVLIGLEQFA